MLIASMDMSLSPHIHPDNVLSKTLRNGMIPLSMLALLSALSTFILLACITYRLIFQRDYHSFTGYNQYVILIYNLLLADFQQAVAFIITFHWLRIGQIESPSVTCFSQAWLINLGDISSGLFVLAIALHTWYSVVLGRRLNDSWFTTGIISIWFFAILMTILGPILKGSHFYLRTNAWCWVSRRYDIYRLWFHYLWVFSVEFITIIVYAHIFYHLRRRLNSIRQVAGNDPAAPQRTARLSQAARYMILYPVIYIILTLPLAAGRMATMAGRKLPMTFYCVAGSFLTSCGWLDTLLYTLTRRVFIKNESAPAPVTKAEATSPMISESKPLSHPGCRWLHFGPDNSHNDQVPLSQMTDPNWPLSTFASINGDKDKHENFTFRHTDSLDRTSFMSGSSHDSHEAIRLSSRSPAAPSPPPPHNQIRQSASEPGLKVGMTETTIKSSSSQQDTLVRNPFDFGILSETKIEVVSMLRDDLFHRTIHHSERP